MLSASNFGFKVDEEIGIGVQLHRRATDAPLHGVDVNLHNPHAVRFEILKIAQLVDAVRLPGCKAMAKKNAGANPCASALRASFTSNPLCCMRSNCAWSFVWFGISDLRHDSPLMADSSWLIAVTTGAPSLSAFLADSIGPLANLHLDPGTSSCRGRTIRFMRRWPAMCAWT